MSLQHLVDLHNVGVRFIALELVTSAIKAKNEPARTFPVRSILFIDWVWHVFYVREDKFEQTKIFQRIEKRFSFNLWEQKGRQLTKGTPGLPPPGYMKDLSKFIHALNHR